MNLPIRRAVFFLSSAALLSALSPGAVAQAEQSQRGIEQTTELEEVVVTGRAQDLIGIAESALQGRVGQAQIERRSILRPGEVLEVIPGLLATQHSGSGKANQFFLRGFNLDHGTDFSAYLDDVPLNLPTHAHGQGYLDLNIVIPELVEVVEFCKGPYYADVGDFSFAGTARIKTFNWLPNGLAKLSVGENKWVRGLFANSNRLAMGNLLYGAEFNFYDGPWEVSEDFKKFNGLFKYTDGDQDRGFTLFGSGYHSEWIATNQIPERAIEQGLVSRFGSLDPTDGGKSGRYTLGMHWWNDAVNTATRINASVYHSNLDL